MPSTRCHAVVINGNIHRNVIVTYGSRELCCDLTISSFREEVHSTDDFNGAILVLPVDATFDLSAVTLTPLTFSSVLSQVASTLPHVVPGRPCRLLFLPL